MEHCYFYDWLCCDENGKYCHEWGSELLLSGYVYFRGCNYSYWYKTTEIKKPTNVGFDLSYRSTI